MNNTNIHRSFVAILLIVLLILSIKIFNDHKSIRTEKSYNNSTPSNTSITTSQQTKSEEKSSTTSETKIAKLVLAQIPLKRTTMASTTIATTSKSTSHIESTTHKNNTTTTTSSQITSQVNSTTVAKNTTTRVATTTNQPSYYPTQQEIDMFCVVVSSETGYCEDMAQKAVAHTVINRLNSPKFPNTIYEVLTQRNQYSCVSNYFNHTYRKGLEPTSEKYAHTMDLIIEAMNESDFTNGAVAYYNPKINGYNNWFEQFQLVYEDQYGRFFVT